jgi:hypothetical protein
MLSYTVQFDEEKSKCAGLAQGIGFGLSILAQFGGDWRKAQQRCAPAEKSVINMI